MADVEEDNGKTNHAMSKLVNRKVRLSGDRNHLHALTADERALVVQSRSAVAVAQFIDAVGASDEDDDDSKANKDHEMLERSVDAFIRGFAGSDVFAVTESVLDGQQNEDEDDGDLKGKANQAKVDANLRGAVALSRHGAADCLEDKTEDVAGDEDLVVESWLELRA